MKLLGVGIGNWRSIGEEMVWVDFRKKLTLISGANNSGKSNVLTAVSRFSPKFAIGRPSLTDLHKRNASTLPKFGFLFQAEEHERAETGMDDGIYKVIFQYVDDQFTLHADTILSFPEDVLHRITIAKQSFFEGLRGDPRLAKIADQPERLRIIALSEIALELLSKIPTFHFIDAERSFGENTSRDSSYLSKLGSWQIPDLQNDSDNRFAILLDSIRFLLKQPNLELQVRDGKELFVREENLRLLMHNHGDGIRQALYILIQILDQPNSIICVEEPESHLNPRMQRDLLQILIEKIPNTIVATTHSQYVLGFHKSVEIIYVRKNEGASIPAQVTEAQNGLSLLRDLGYSAGDLIRSGYVVWVEGPSDRFYIRKWLSIMDDDLVEGTDFTILMYGGSSLKYISFAQDPPSQFMEILSISPFATLVVDSDKSTLNAPLTRDVQRIQSECATTQTHLWITKGRTIENYVPGQRFRDAFETLTFHDLASELDMFETVDNFIQRIANPLANGEMPKYSNHKPDYARKISSILHDTDMTQDLKEKTIALVKRIRDAKDMRL